MAREINTHKRNDLFAATFLLEALKMTISMLATANDGEIFMINDMSRAFFHARVKRHVYVQLPKDDQSPCEGNMCGKLKCSMYGTRDVAKNWYEEYSPQSVAIGFQQGGTSPCIFLPPRKEYPYIHPRRRLCKLWDAIGFGLDEEKVVINIQSTHIVILTRRGSTQTSDDIQSSGSLAWRSGCCLRSGPETRRDYIRTVKFG